MKKNAVRNQKPTRNPVQKEHKFVFLPIGKTLPERIYKLTRLIEGGVTPEVMRRCSLSQAYNDHKRKIVYGIGGSFMLEKLYSNFCIGCGCVIEYGGPLSLLTIKVGKYEGFLCVDCYKTGAEVCEWSFNHRGKCGEATMCLALCLLRIGVCRDMRKLIMSRILKSCSGGCVGWKAKPREFVSFLNW